ncbi:MAG: DDE-type integrase/transposase/recombinase [Verrucomicrobiales bacterium]
MVDEFTRECHLIHVDRRIRSADVRRQLDRLIRLRGPPEHIRSDKGSKSKRIGDRLPKAARRASEARQIDNNLIENVLRPAKLGLMNYLFIGKAEAGASTALFYTLLANCAVRDLDSEIYLAEVIRRLLPTSTPEQIAELTPAKLSVSLATDRAEEAA